MSSDNTVSIYNQASLLVQKADYANALKLIYPTVKSHPTFFKGWLLFSRCLYAIGHVKEAVDIALNAENVDPMKREFEQISLLMEQQDYSAAEQIALQMLKEFGPHPKAYFTLGRIFLQVNMPEEGIEVLEQAVEHLPSNLSIRKLLSDGYASAGQYSNTIESLKTLTTLDECFDTLWLLITHLLKYGQYEDIEQYCQRALHHAAGDAEKVSQINLVYGQMLRIVGQRDKSIATIKRSLESNPQNMEAWWALADFKNYPFNEGEMQKLNALTRSNPPSLSTSPLYFALAKMRETQVMPEQSISDYRVANACKSAGHFKVESLKREYEQRQAAYTAKALQLQAPIQNDSPTPIFIVGLPRSGSTLLEQMLATHSKIDGTMEQPTLPDVEAAAQRYALKQYGVSLTQALERFTPDELSMFKEQYLRESAIFRSGTAPFFIDKQLFNHRLVGFIHKILPEAVIIDVRRDPFDCAISLFKQYFPSGVEFSYDFQDIGTTYNAYTALMDYWHCALPNRVLTVHYEALVSEPEKELTKIFNHIGLHYENECLQFSHTKRPIHTASSEQVREPLNTNAIGRWSDYELYIDKSFLTET